METSLGNIAQPCLNQTTNQPHSQMLLDLSWSFLQSGLNVYGEQLFNILLRLLGDTLSIFSKLGFIRQFIYTHFGA